MKEKKLKDLKEIKLEIDLENEFRKWVKRQKGTTYKWTGCREKLDLIVVSHTGVIGLLELKNPNGTGRLSSQQAQVLRDVGKIDREIATCADSWEACVKWYENLARRYSND